MIKLSDTQAILLSSASQRPNGSLLPRPASIAGGARLAKPLAGLLARGLAEERGTDVADETHRDDGDLRFGLFITAAGEAAIGIGKAPAAGLEPAREEETTRKEEPTPGPTISVEPATLVVSPRRTKSALMLGLLTRECGATLAELIEATGWLPHTTRAALTGLRKKGHDVQRGKRGDATFYMVATAATAGTAATATPDVAGER